MLSNDIAELERGLTGLLDIDAFDITISNTLSRAIRARNMVKRYLHLAKECKAEMEIVLYDLNTNEDKCFQGRVSTAFGRVLYQARAYVREGNRPLRTCETLCRRAIVELQAEDDDEE